MTREAWIGVMAAALGIDAAACHKSVPPDSEVSSREVVSVAPPTPSALVSASASPIVDASKPLAESDASIGGLAGTIGTGGIAIGSNPNIRSICGAMPRNEIDDPVFAPRLNAQISPVTGAQNGDERGVAAIRPAFRACANKALVNDPALKDGKLTLEISIASNGDVSNSTVSSSTLSTEVNNCILNRSKRASFEPNAPHTITFTIDIKRQP